MIIQVVNFNLKDLSDADYRSACDGLAPELARVPGLISKVWLADEPSNTYGGVYTWIDQSGDGRLRPKRLLQGVRDQSELREHHLDGVRNPRGPKPGHPGFGRDRGLIDAQRRITR